MAKRDLSAQGRRDPDPSASDVGASPPTLPAEDAGLAREVADAPAAPETSGAEGGSSPPAMRGADSLEALEQALLEGAFAPHEDNLADRMRIRELARAAARDRAETAIRRPEEAAAAIRDAAFLDVQNVRHLTMLARSALDGGDAALARAAARRAVLIEPQSMNAHGFLAEALIACGETEAGKRHLAASIFLGSDDPEEASKAVADCHARFVALDPHGRHGLEDVADALVAHGAKPRAVAAFMNGAAWSQAPELAETLLSLCAGGVARRETAPSPAPLTLISQVQRSGGSLLAQLFDGHPEVFAHPHELQFGRPNKWDWPAVDIGEGDLRLLAGLFELRLLKFALRGYTKADGNKAASDDTRPMSFSLETLVAEFRRHAARRVSRRDVLDAYFRAFFAAWKECKPTGAEHYVVGFTPRMSSTPASMEGFFGDYPDGRLISCIRDPATWYASSSRHDPEYASLTDALPHWTGSTQAALKFARERPDATHLLTYEDLVRDTPTVMNRIADWLGIKRRESLYVPTYAGQAIMPNSSFVVAEFGVHAKSLDAGAALDEEAVARIRKEATPLYEEAVAAIRTQNKRLDGETPQ